MSKFVPVWKKGSDIYIMRKKISNNFIIRLVTLAISAHSGIHFFFFLMFVHRTPHTFSKENEKQHVLPEITFVSNFQVFCF